MYCGRTRLRATKLQGMKGRHRLPDRSFVELLGMTVQSSNVFLSLNTPPLHRRMAAMEVLHELATAAVLAEPLDVLTRLTVDGASCKAASVGGARPRARSWHLSHGVVTAVGRMGPLVKQHTADGRRSLQAAGLCRRAMP